MDSANPNIPDGRAQAGNVGEARRLTHKSGAICEVIYSADEDNPKARVRGVLYGKLIEWDAGYWEFRGHGGAVGAAFYGRCKGSAPPRPGREVIQRGPVDWPMQSMLIMGRKRGRK